MSTATRPIHDAVRRLLSLLALCLVWGGAVQAEESVIFKILAVNPSDTETKQVTIRGVLPPEVKAESVLDPDGLEVEYDSQAGAYVVTGTVSLEPKRSVIKNILIADVWVVPEESFARLEDEVGEIMKKLAGTSFAERGQLMANAITRRLTELRAHQQLPFLNPEQHISRYREDLTALQMVESELVSLRQLMVMAALEPATQAVLPGGGTEASSAGAGQERGSLSILTTWRLIFIILALLGLVSLSFFLVWQRQLKLQLAKQTAREPDAQDDVLANGNGTSAPAPQTPPALEPRVPGPTLPSAGAGQPNPPRSL